MHDAPSYDPLQQTSFFANGAASRTLVANTVARGQLRDDEHLYTGKINGQPATEFPMPVTDDVMARGQERFNVYCSPCHGRTGQGDGMIVQRGFRAPPSYHEERLRNVPVGYLFDVMTNGFGAMQDYSAQVTVDRSLGHRGVHSRVAAQSARDGERCAGGSPRRSRSPCGSPGATRTGEPATVNTTYAPPAADIDVPRSRALIVAASVSSAARLAFSSMPSSSIARG